MDATPKTRTRSRPRRARGAQIARQLGLSPATVSLVLNGRADEYGIATTTARSVRDEAKRMNYQPSIVARQLAGKRSNAVGVLINTEAIADPRLIQKMEVIAARRGIRFIVGHAVSTHEQVKEYLNDFHARGVDAVISFFHDHPDYGQVILQELAQFERVIYYEKPQGVSTEQEEVCYVAPDCYEVGRLGVRHLLERGRKRIALVLNDLLFTYARMRHQAYGDTLRAAAAEKGTGSIRAKRRAPIAGRSGQSRKLDRPSFSPLVWVMDQQPGAHWMEPFTAERALQVVDELVVRRKADAIVAVNDTFAARIVAALRRRGRRVPDDVAVVGCDNLELATMIDPSLTTIDLRLDDLAEAMTNMLFDLLDHGAVPEDRRAVRIEPVLIQRESS